MGSGFKKQKKQMQALQQQLMQVQEDLKNKLVTGTSGQDLVTITLNGEYEMIDIKIKKECIDPNDQDGLEDLIRSAYQQACSKLKEEESQFSSSPLFDMWKN